MAEDQSPRAAAARAVSLARGIVEALKAGDLEAYEAAAPAYEQLCTALLRWPLEEFDGEASALVAEIARLQRDVCSLLDGLLVSAAGEIRSLRANRKASAAYAAAHRAAPGRTRVA